MELTITSRWEVAKNTSFLDATQGLKLPKTIDAYKQNTEEFIASDTTLTAYLSSRNTANAGTIYTYLKSKVPNQDSNQQYVLGLSASMGGGNNTTYLATSLSVAQDNGNGKGIHDCRKQPTNHYAI